MIADSGRRPPPGFAENAHASPLALEFSYGSELIFGSCGPAPADLAASKALFRQGIAHSTPTIDAQNAAPTPPLMTLAPADQLLSITTAGYARHFGVDLERRITLLSGGTTLVGQDRVIAHGTASGTIAVRFHLAPGVRLRRNQDESMVRLQLPNGAIWSFLWEGAAFRDEESVRQSAYVGLHKTRQLVLETRVVADSEIAWIFTLEQP